jgi:hypothetical protein
MEARPRGTDASRRCHRPQARVGDLWFSNSRRPRRDGLGRPLMPETAGSCAADALSPALDASPAPNETAAESRNLSVANDLPTSRVTCP